MAIRRRSTRNLERLLAVCERGYTALTRSMEYAQHSLRRNRDKDFANIREMLASLFGFMAALRWALGIGLTEQDLKYVLVEVEAELGPPTEARERDLAEENERLQALVAEQAAEIARLRAT